MTRQLVILLYLLGLISGCVSVKIAGNKTEKAENLNFIAPGKPFTSHDNKSADRAWISNVTRNTIAVLTDCGNVNDATLSSLESDTLSVFSHLKIISTSEKSYNGRVGLFTSAEGLIDGVPMHMSLVTLKKNGCDFTLSYFGRRQFQSNEISIFEKFTQEFKAP